MALHFYNCSASVTATTDQPVSVMPTDTRHTLRHTLRLVMLIMYSVVVNCHHISLTTSSLHLTSTAVHSSKRLEALITSHTKVC
jgi:hypothetical protein